LQTVIILIIKMSKNIRVQKVEAGSNSGSPVASRKNTNIDEKSKFNPGYANRADSTHNKDSGAHSPVAIDKSKKLFSVSYCLF
jgi:hypothetical protein